MDVHTLRVVERWHKMSAKRWWRMIPASYGASVHHEVSRKIADHLACLRTRKAKARKCEECKHYDGRCNIEAVRYVPGMPCTDTSCRICFAPCGPSGRLWEWKDEPKQEVT